METESWDWMRPGGHAPLSSTLQAAEQQGRAEQVKQAEEVEGRLGVQLAALGENVATLKREWQGGQRRAAELEKQTDELRGEIAVLEATVQNNQDERRALLERSGVRGQMSRVRGQMLEVRGQMLGVRC